MGSCCFSPQHCVGFLFLDLCLPSSASPVRTSLSHTIFHIHLCHTPSLSHSLSHTHTFFVAQSVTQNFVTHHLPHTSLPHTTLPHTIFHIHLCHTQSFTHNFVTHTTLSHIIFHIPLCHTPSFIIHLCQTPSSTGTW